MILPTKHLNQERALLTIGARVIAAMEHPITVSALWERLSNDLSSTTTPNAIHYDSFVLSLDLLFLIGTIQLNEGLITRTNP